MHVLCCVYTCVSAHILVFFIEMNVRVVFSKRVIAVVR
jgi:hypothetical protein